MIGHTRVVSMYAVCVSGMFIYTLDGAFTIFHALAIFTFATTTLGVLAIRRGLVRAHVGNMIGSWIGALFAGGFAAFVPGRYIPSLAVEQPAVLWGTIIAIVIVATVWVVLVLTRLRRTPRRAVSATIREQAPSDSR